MVRITKEEGLPTFGTFVRERIGKNRNCIILVTGNPGTGKTYSAISLGCWFHELMGLPDLFGPDSWVFSIRSLLKIMHQNTASVEKAAFLRGRPFLYEEVSEEQLNTRSNSQAAVSTIQTLATFRSLGCILIMTVPREGILQKSLKSFCDVWLKTQGIDYHNKHCFINIRYTTWSDELDKMRAYYSFVEGPTHEYKNKTLVVPKPPDSLIAKYEAHKLAFQHRIYGEKLEKFEEREKERAEKKEKKKNRYPQKCRFCAFEWVSPRPLPMRCPACHKLQSLTNLGTRDSTERHSLNPVSISSDMEKSAPGPQLNAGVQAQ